MALKYFSGLTDEQLDSIENDNIDKAIKKSLQEFMKMNGPMLNQTGNIKNKLQALNEISLLNLKYKICKH